MPLVFTKSEIREQLLEFGFEVDDDQLGEFVKDLKKLIKNEEKKRRERKGQQDFQGPLILISSPGTTSSVSPYSTPGTHGTTTSTTDTTPGATGTDAVDINVIPIPPPPPAIPTQTRRPVKPPPKKPAEKRVLGERSNTSRENQDENRLKEDVGRRSPPAPPVILISGSSSSIETESYLSSSSEGSERTRVRLPPESVRHDPVSLYHFYKAIWEKQRGPGEDARMQLRWNVRAGTIGRVPCDPKGVPTKYLRPPLLSKEVKNTGYLPNCFPRSTYPLHPTRFRI